MYVAGIDMGGERQCGRVYCLRKQHNGRDSASNHKPSVLYTLTTTPPRPLLIKGLLKKKASPLHSPRGFFSSTKPKLCARTIPPATQAKCTGTLFFYQIDAPTDPFPWQKRKSSSTAKGESMTVVIFVNKLLL